MLSLPSHPTSTTPPDTGHPPGDGLHAASAGPVPADGTATGATTAPAASALHILPPELQRKITGLLLPADYRNFSVTCRQFHHLLRDPVTLRLYQAQIMRRTSAWLDRLRQPAATPVEAAQALEFLQGCWDFLLGSPRRQDSARALFMQCMALARRQAAVDLHMHPAGIADSHRLVLGLQKLATRLQPGEESGHIWELHCCCSDLTRQLVLGTAPDQRAPCMQSLIDALLTGPMSPYTGHYALNLHQLLRELPVPDRPAVRRRLSELAQEMHAHFMAQLGLGPAADASGTAQ